MKTAFIGGTVMKTAFILAMALSFAAAACMSAPPPPDDLPLYEGIESWAPEDPDQAPGQGTGGPAGNGWSMVNIWEPSVTEGSVEFDNKERIATVTVKSKPEAKSIDGAFDWFYTGEQDRLYAYDFEAWTNEGVMYVDVGHRWETLAGKLEITPERKKFHFEGKEFTSKDYWIQDGKTNEILTFQFFDQTGTINIKVLSIKAINQPRR
jgi:hypothetical protein